MNLSITMGRVVREPEIRYSQSNESMSVARFTLAVDRKIRTEGGQNADFISYVAFGKKAEFLDKYVHKGTKLLVTGHIQTGSYTNKDGNKVYTTDIACDEIEFAESKSSSSSSGSNTFSERPPFANDGFMNIPEGIDEDLPFAQPSR